MVFYIVVILLLIFCFYLCEKQNFETQVVTPVTASVEVEEKLPTNWNEQIKNMDLDPSISKSHNKYVSNIRQYSSGANFTSIADDNTSPMYTNFVGFSRPRHVPIDPTARQVPDIDENVFKRNKHMYFH